MKTQDIMFAIINADKNTSKLNKHWKALRAYALTSERIKHLINNLCAHPGIKYLDLGTYRGGTLLAAMFENELKVCYGVDNYGKSNTTPENATDIKALKATFKDFKLEPLVIRKDFDILTKEDVGGNTFNLINYDPGPGKELVLCETLSPLLHLFDKQFIILINNYTTGEVRYFLEKWIKENSLDIKFAHELRSRTKSDQRGWWGGLCVLQLEKKK